jgi:hypothetical protein
MFVFNIKCHSTLNYLKTVTIILASSILNIISNVNGQYVKSTRKLIITITSMATTQITNNPTKLHNDKTDLLKKQSKFQ